MIPQLSLQKKIVTWLLFLCSMWVSFSSLAQVSVGANAYGAANRWGPGTSACASCHFGSGPPNTAQSNGSGNHLFAANNPGLITSAFGVGGVMTAYMAGTARPVHTVSAADAYSLALYIGQYKAPIASATTIVTRAGTAGTRDVYPLVPTDGSSGVAQDAGGLVVTNGASGTASASIGGSNPVSYNITYTPNSPSFIGTDSFTYRLVNPAGNSGNQTVSVTVVGLTSGDSVTGAVGQVLSYTISTNGTLAGAGPFSVAGTLPPGVTLNANSGVISGAPDSTATGSYPVTVSANTTAGIVSKTVTFDVFGITSAGTASGAQNAVFATYQITSAIPPTSFGLTGTLPQGLTFSPSTGQISGTPTFSGIFPVTIQVNTAQGALSKPLTITITSAGIPIISTTPTLLAAPSVTGVVGTPIQSIQIKASNPPIVAGSYIATGIAATGLQFDSNTGIVSGAPVNSGDFAITLGASNSSGAATQNMVIRINPNGVPVISSPTALSGTVRAPFAGAQIVASGPPISAYSASGLPNGMSVNSVTGAISGTPTLSGNFDVTLTATNVVGTGSKAVVLSISPDAKPQITGPTFAALTAGVAAAPIQIVATNPAISSYAATGLPAGLVLNVQTGVISGTPSAPTPVNNPAQVTLTATNSVGVGSATVPFTVIAPIPNVKGVAMSVPLNTPTSVDLLPSITGFGVSGISIVATPKHGTATVNGTMVTYTPANNYFGSDSFSYAGFGVGGVSPPGVVSVTVTGRPDPTKDATVTALVGSQLDTAQRFAGVQITNLQRRMESLHSRESSGGSTASSFAGRASGAGALVSGGTQATLPNSNPTQYGVSSASAALQGNGISSPSLSLPGQSIPTALSTAEGLDMVANGLGLKALPLTDALASLAKNRSVNLASLVPGRAGSMDSGAESINFWAEGTASFGLRDPNGAVTGFEFNSNGISFGADKRFSDKLALGLGLGFARDRTTFGTDGSQSDSRSMSLSAYGSYQPTPTIFVDGLIGFGGIEFDNRRYVVPIDDFALSKRKGTQLFASLALGYESRDNGFLVSPYGRLDYSSVRLQDSTEAGAGAYALTYAGQTGSSLQGALGLRAETVFATNYGWAIPKVRLEYQHEFQADRSATYSYADQAGLVAYSATGAGYGRESVLLGLGSDFVMRGGWTLGLDYQLNQRLGQDSNYTLRFKVSKDLDGKGLPKLVGGFAEFAAKPLDLQVDAGYAYEDNVTRAKEGPDRLSDNSYSVNVSKTFWFSLTEQSRFSVSTTLSGEKFQNYNGLSRISGSLEGEYQYRNSSEFDSPTFGVFGRLTGEQFDSNLRDGYRYSVGLSVRQPLTDRISLFGSYSHNERRANSAVFNTIDNALKFNADYSLSDAQTLYLSTEFRAGDITSSGRASLENVSSAKVLAQDDVFPAGQFFSYRLDGRTVLTTLGYNLGFGARDSLDLSWRRVQSTPSLRPSFATSPESYITNQIALTYLVRF
jgi:uncharacterized protein with beta-barrel porin domain